MRRDPRCKAALADPVPLKLAEPPNAGPALPADLEPLIGIDDLARILSCSRRLVERMRASKKIIHPDMYICRMPRWRPERIRHWIEGGNKL